MMLSAFVRTADHDGAHGLWIGEKDLDVLNDGIHTLPNGMPNATGKCFLRCFLREYKRVLQISGKLFIFRYERWYIGIGIALQQCFTVQIKGGASLYFDKNIFPPQIIQHTTDISTVKIQIETDGKGVGIDTSIFFIRNSDGCDFCNMLQKLTSS